MIEQKAREREGEEKKCTCVRVDNCRGQCYTDIMYAHMTELYTGAN